MDRIALFTIICINIMMIQARHDLNIKKLIELIKRRNSQYHSSPIFGAPRYPKHLPEAEPILPGHTLLRPSGGMLKSAIKYPLRDSGGFLVYGNKDNIGLANDKNERVLYTDFRKSNLLTTIAETIREYKRQHTRPEVSIPVSLRYPVNYEETPLDSIVTHTDEENNAKEIIDELDPERNFFDEDVSEDFRRKSKSKYRHRNIAKSRRSSEDRSSTELDTESETDSDSDTGSSDIERNPGNPYTIHKNKYKQNWMWNHFMDGDHMNINPHAPPFKDAGPSGIDLMFGRKWWYFNQDDYKPMG